MKKRTLTILTLLFLSGCTLTNLAAKGNQNHHITILDQKTLAYSPRQNLPFTELSDLAYDPKNKRLYMIGDKGYFYQFKATFGTKIQQLQYLKAFPIRDQKNRVTHPDSEGLTRTSKGELIVSFEHRPQVSKISTTGKILNDYPLPKKLQNKRHYQNSNSIFEAVAYHPRYGILVAAEHPIDHAPNNQQSIYALSGKTWHFQLQPYANNAITAMEVMDDGNLLIIERAYNGLTKPFVVCLTKLYLNRCNAKQECPTQRLATFDSSKGWGYNNFEGLTKVGKNRYLMISDNNNRAILPTTLLYFEVHP